MSTKFNDSEDCRVSAELRGLRGAPSSAVERGVQAVRLGDGGDMAVRGGHRKGVVMTRGGLRGNGTPLPGAVKSVNLFNVPRE